MMNKKYRCNLFFLISLVFVIFSPNKIFARDFFWESPIQITSGDSRFPRSATNGRTSYIFWQEVDTRTNRIWLSCQYMNDTGEWITNSRFAGPFSYSGEVPDVYSAAVSANGTIAVSALAESNRSAVYVSNDGAKTFERYQLPQAERSAVAPRIYAVKNGGFRVFSSVGSNDTFTLYTASSSNGRQWSDFVEFTPSRGMTNPFIPVLTYDRNSDYVVFQSQLRSEGRFSYQLYYTHSADDGSTWATPILVTGQNSMLQGDTRSYATYNNQQPSITVYKNEVYLAWERSYYTSETTLIVLAKINNTGIIPGSVELLSNRGSANRAVIFSYEDELYVVWFDTRTGAENVYMAQKKDGRWATSSLSTGRQSNIFAFPVISSIGKNRKELSFVWQQSFSNNPSIFRLDPDLTVDAPRVAALSFTEGKRSTAEKVRMQVVLPNDSSGITGFSWLWTKDIHQEPPATVTNLPNENLISVSAEDDGQWYLKVRAQDNAGNWSSSGVIAYYRDLTPPLAPVINDPKIDRFGFLSSNTFDMLWRPNDSDDDVEGYTWNLEYVAPIDARIEQRARHPIAVSDARVNEIVDALLKRNSDAEEKADRPPASMISENPVASYENRSNGLYVFSVAAIDTVGNIGPAAKIKLILNKYVPVTYMTSVDLSLGIFGDAILSITGGGFTYDGTISKIYIDKDGEEPYDMTIERGSGKYDVVSDNSITNLSLGTELVRGTYRIGLLHPDRGLYMSPPFFTIDENGTVKLEKQYNFVPEWTVAVTSGKWHIQFGDILLWAVFALAFVGLILAGRGIVQTAKITYEVRSEAHALITGAVMPQEKKRRAIVLKGKGTSLRVKMVGYTVGLVAAIVTLVAVPLGYNMTRTQERTLSQGLEERVNVLLEGLSSGVRAYMPTQNVLELSYLPNQSSAMQEAEYVTILGYPSDNSNTNLTHVWATNDTNILEKIDTTALSAGVSNLIDGESIEIAARCANLNADAINAGSEIARNIVELNAEGAQLALKTDSASVARREEIGAITTQLTSRFDTTMSELAATGRGSIPQFDSGSLNRENTEYLFYHPVIYRQGSSQEYVRGIILIKVATDDLIKNVDTARRSTFVVAIVIAVIAIAIGAIGSLILATVIVSPLRKLTALVTEIGQTKNKERLAGREIEIRSRDEIGQLGETVNEMTRDLVKAALDEKLLMDGKVVQQTFLPLNVGDGGNKQTVAQLKEDRLECFGYYEGASAVSGDYFDYKKLDNRWYVIIKCDASGHGVPAALIMTIVATLFRKYFENWTFKKNGTHIDMLITQINDFIESLGLKGKFAAIILCLFDTETGDVYMCNAGDNVVHIFDGAGKKQKVVTLSETPAAGPLPSFMVDMKGGFKVEKINIKKGDVLFLYTDGIEEATRKFRDSNFAVMKCAEPGMADGAEHGNHKVGEESEQLNPDRVQEIIEAVFTKKVYVLEKYHNPIQGEHLQFDFTTCEGTIEDAIIALASVEKVFRMYKSPETGEIDTVRADRRIDEFLKKHFNRYSYYCSTRQDISGESNYCEYTNLREDEQLDDLTLLAVRRI